MVALKPPLTYIKRIIKKRLDMKTSSRRCPCCDSNETKPFANEKIDFEKISGFTYSSRKEPEFMCFKLVECLSCQLVYAPNPPDSMDLTTAYSKADFDTENEAACASTTYAKSLTPFLSKIPLKGGAVDVGAGSGALLPWLKDVGFNPVIGIEPSKAAIESAPISIKPFIREGMFSIDLLSNVDPSLICSFMTLEHLKDPGEFIKLSYKALRPDGMIAVVVHNRQAILNKLLGLKSPIIDIEHLQLFNRSSILTLLKNGGFEDIEVQSICNAYPIRYWVRLLPLPKTLKKMLQHFLNKLQISKVVIPINVGNIIAVGIKK